MGKSKAQDGDKLKDIPVGWEEIQGKSPVLSGC